MKKINQYKWSILLFFLIYTIGAAGQSSININVIGQPVVGENITIEVTANHQDGISEIWLIKDNNYGNKTEMLCNGTTECTLQIETTLDYIGSVVFDAILWGMPNNYITETSISVNFECQSEYCNPDPEISQFFSWMRSVGYDECVIEKYYTYTSVPELKSRMRKILKKRPIGYNQTDSIIFYDIIPTDNEAAFIGMDIGETPNCEYSSLTPEFCPNPTSADYTFLENHWKTVFGINFTFQYQRIEISYVDEFGPPTWNSALEKWQFLIPNSFYSNNLETGNIAHFAVESWNGEPVREINGGKASAQLFYEPTTLFKFGVFTHEWGHAKGLSHTFVEIDGVRTFLTPDGIMSNTYIQNTNMFDPLDPLERYVFEPENDYIDQNTFANTYSQGIVASNQFNNICENIDPAVTAFTLDSSTETHYTFKATLDNFGTIDATFINVFFYDGNITNSPLIERTYEAIEPNTPFDIYVTIDKNLINNDEVFIKVDPLNLISEETEANNTLNFTNTLSISELERSNFQFNIYPNPVSDELTLRFNLKFKSDITVEIYDLNMRKLEEMFLGKKDFGQQEGSISTSSLSSGFYFLILNQQASNGKKYRSVQKIIKR